MLLIPTVALIPLVTDANGVVRISKTRITLDTVVTAFLEGVNAPRYLWVTLFALSD
ncbi:hypothetical protein [Nostoc sp.]|uniref:hypothetical protein n=1 Tax=Nostoc sp. TaxID=1180 RepID=UPI002FF6801C